MKEMADTLRGKILDGAIELFIVRGVEKVTTRELTEHLGISRSHIYHYFRDWQALCIEALTHFMLSELEEVKARIAHLPPGEKLKALVDNYLPEGQDAVWQLYVSLWQLAAHNAAWAALADQLMHQWKQFLTEIIITGEASGAFRVTDSQRITRQLAALLNGYSDKLVVAPSAAARQQAIDDIDAFIAMVL
ncbi:TetR/AcrR family transcriptional regulator [Erwinia sp. ErVv1]|uniref:TetR/AcrR family transcriptional regulator n=1 Tax=Erwinia sp. ErVv1 TaxID=1603299 RepID=UPI000830A570|nr:TetR/AcrR family transcriptional regulator [Erwinia sp. ErVv1]